MEVDFTALSPPNSIVSEELSNGGYSSPFQQLSPMSSSQQQQHNIPSNQEKVTSRLKWFKCTVKPVYNGHPWDPKIMAVVDRWSLFRGTFML